MGAAINRIKRERANSDSEHSSDSETGYYQERKNMEFFFKPQDIERHMDFALNGDINQGNYHNHISNMSNL